jgi:large subunit ribosomal protein L31
MGELVDSWFGFIPCAVPGLCAGDRNEPQPCLAANRALSGDVEYVVVKNMKKEIHPQYFVTSVKCGCGNSFTTRSTKPELKVDICNVCHPFYTGKLKFVDTAGRIEKFKNKFAAAGYASLKRGKKPAETKTES